MGLLDFLFGTSDSESKNKGGFYNQENYGDFSDQSHYNYHYDNALAGDSESIHEMEEVFGEDWDE